MRDPRLTDFAKSMRRELTEPERRLWHQLRGKRFEGVKFRRQNVVGRYIVDFYSRNAMLIIEVDGESHGFQQEYDAERDRYFRELGFNVVRFMNDDVMRNMDGVLAAISLHLATHVQVAPHPTLPPEGGRALS